MSNDLFGNDPALVSRDSRGRFCTKERAEYERVKRDYKRLILENSKLRRQMEMYKRQAEAMNDKFIEIFRSKAKN